MEAIQALQIGKSWFPEQAGSGLDRVYHALTLHLPEVGISVHGLVAGSSQVSSDRSHNVNSFASDKSSIPHRLIGARNAADSLASSTSIDIIASHFALYTAPVLGKLPDVPLVVHFHGPWADESAVEDESALFVKAKKWIERYVYRRGSRFIVLSEAFREVLATKYDIPRSAIRIVPGGVDIDRFDVGISKDIAQERLGWPTDRPILLSVRRLARRMGLDHLVEAMQQIREQVPDALLLIAGEGPIADAIRAQIEARDLQDHVRLLGFVPDEDLPLAYRAADITVVPTEALEGFGLITIESLAAGTPVLVTPRGGLPEVVNDLDSGLIFDAANSSSIAGRITDTLTGQITLPSAAACRSYACERFAWPIIARKTRRVYEEVL